MQERTFLSAMLFHTRAMGERLPHFRDQVKALSLEDKQWFVEQFAREFDIEIIEGRPAGMTPQISTALVLIAQPLPHNESLVKGYIDA